eukprot:CAMPEP_0169237526 /NCGR_PEP_ID=MMETSP1016-20121227/29856_1 /TAXON_ID=342587 /ORGANISM="Karlodinium micrum, Strain CCMP2283" /LENGTH=325 /DNA_ID=CAMNT_0009317261 /DNA_START=28 /DNA_END=1007 /DNA_ORIENTATION=+
MAAKTLEEASSLPLSYSSRSESAPEFDAVARVEDSPLASGAFVGDTALAIANTSLRRLKASPACQACCGGGDCSSAFKGTEAGTCCLGDSNTFWCCPAASAKCALAFGHCMGNKQTVTSHTKTVGRHYNSRVHSSVSPIMSAMGLMLFIAGVMMICYICFKFQQTAKHTSMPGPAGVGPNGNAVVYGQPVGQCNSGNGALYGGMGFLGGLTMGSMMMGPGMGWGGYGYGGGYGDTYMTETTTMSEVGGGEFMGDGGGFGGDFGGGGGFGGDFGGGGFDMGMGGDFCRDSSACVVMKVKANSIALDDGATHATQKHRFASEAQLNR